LNNATLLKVKILYSCVKLGLCTVDKGRKKSSWSFQDISLEAVGGSEENQKEPAGHILQ
jgi:hypothetical protein